MSTNSFRLGKFADFEIVDAQEEVVGHVRVKPNGILWAAKGSRVWHGLTLDKFGELAEQHGKKQKK